MSDEKQTGLMTRMPKAQNSAAAHVLDHVTRFAPALPSFIDPDQFSYAAVVAANEIEKPCTPISVLTAAHNCAKMGLMPGKALGLAYFVPFKNKQSGETECQLIPGYRGYLDLAYRNNFLRLSHCEVVRSGEEFDNWVDHEGPKIFHKIPIDRDNADKSIVGAYCLSVFSNGGRSVKVINKAQIKKAEQNTPAWKYHFAEMAMKTAIRRAAKGWRLTSHMALAVHLDDQAEMGLRQDVVDVAGLDDVKGRGQRVRTLKLAGDEDDTVKTEGGKNEISDDEKQQIIKDEIERSKNERDQ